MTSGQIDGKMDTQKQLNVPLDICGGGYVVQVLVATRVDQLDRVAARVDLLAADQDFRPVFWVFRAFSAAPLLDFQAPRPGVVEIIPRPRELSRADQRIILPLISCQQGSM